MAREFAGGMVDGFKTQLEATDAEGIKDAVVDWIADQQSIDKIRDELVKEMGSSSATQIDLALTDLFGARATPIDTLVSSMATAAEQNAVQLQQVGADIGKSIEEGLDTRFAGIGEKIVQTVLMRLGEAA
jgi:hypothetical protein